MNKLISILAILVLLAVLIYGLSHAWMALGVLKFAFMILAVGVIGFAAGRISK
jgi:hypothetical protein